MTRYMCFGFLFVGCLAILAGCSSRDPYARDDVWYPNGSNAANLAAQVADPADLAGGRSDYRQSSAPAAKAVGRILTDTLKPLGDGTATTTTTGGGPPAAAPTGGG